MAKGINMRILFIILGFIFTGFGLVGVVLPILPTTPFLLLASFFFAKGSAAFHRWFTDTRLYKKHLDDFVKTRAMARKTKITLLAFASSMLMIPLITVDILPVRIFIIGLIVFKYYYFIFRIKTIKTQEGGITE